MENAIDGNINTKWFSENLGTIKIDLQYLPKKFRWITANDNKLHPRTWKKWVIKLLGVEYLYNENNKDENFTVFPSSGYYLIKEETLAPEPEPSPEPDPVPDQ